MKDRAAVPRLEPQQNPDGTWGIAVTGAGLSSAVQPHPLEVEVVLDPELGPARSASGYSSLRLDDGRWFGAGETPCGRSVFAFRDEWRIDDNVLRLDRTVTVLGDAEGGFLTGATLHLETKQVWTDVEWFVPGMIYGGFDHLSDNAIGGASYYKPGDYTVRIREERMPAPLMSGYFRDGSSLAVLNPTPSAESFAAECQDVSLTPVTDERIGFGAVGAQETASGLDLGYWYPGSEGEHTYANKTGKGCITHHAWRYRLHPIRDGFQQRYQIAFRFGHDTGPAESWIQDWRWAWQTLQPKPNPQDLDSVRRCIVDALATNVWETGNVTGLPLIVDAFSGEAAGRPRTILGFIGKALESAEFMLAESLLDASERGQELRRKAEAIAQTFLRLRVDPPEGEGFQLGTGEVTNNWGKLVYLRCFCDDVKALLRAYAREAKAGREHPDWLAWAQRFADWLLTQEQPDGGFPRAWLPPNGEVYADSPNSSFNAIPLLVLLSRFTGDPRYLEAAVRTGEFSWHNGQSRGRFVGGTIDNPNVIDKEAATLSVEGYLALYGATQDLKWVKRAELAAGIAETWVYIWDVPMPADADNEQIGWKRGIPSTGLQLIATGHSLVDAYMAFDADEFAHLHLLTGDPHYREVAAILLHNTKAMVALPGRTYGMVGPGWQEEHYSLAPPRGIGRHHLWLPWVATSQLNGIFGLMELSPDLYQQLTE